MEYAGFLDSVVAPGRYSVRLGSERSSTNRRARLNATGGLAGRIALLGPETIAHNKLADRAGPHKHPSAFDIPHAGTNSLGKLGLRVFSMAIILFLRWISYFDEVLMSLLADDWAERKLYYR